MNKNKIFDEIFSGIWLWSFMFTLVSIGLPILDDRKRLGIPRGLFIPIDAVVGLLFLLLIVINQKIASKHPQAAKNELRPMTLSKKYLLLLAVGVIDIGYAVVLNDFYFSQTTLPWLALGVIGFAVVLLLFGVFRLYFTKTDPA